VNEGDVVLAALPQADGRMKNRPAALDRGDDRLVRRASPNEGVVDWLLACPVKGFFIPIESESTSCRTKRRLTARPRGGSVSSL